MSDFDVSVPWLILAPEASIAAKELLYSLRRICAAAALNPERINSADSARVSEEEGQRAIVLNCADGNGGTGYSWRSTAERVEIWGDSPKGLLNGVYDFLEALGVRWIKPGPEGFELPSFVSDAEGPIPGLLRMKRVSAHRKQNGDRQALVLLPAFFGHDGCLWLQWAARNRYDTVLFLVGEKSSALASHSEQLYLRQRSKLLACANEYGLSIELGGRCLSRLVPRTLFLRNKELFRMREGKRTSDFNFCPTNPDTIRLLQKNAAEWFARFPEASAFHFWPDKARENSWCACPSCRAFSPWEQALIATNAMADSLAQVRPGAWISCKGAREDDTEFASVKPRPNVRLLPKLGEDSDEQILLRDGLDHGTSLNAAISLGLRRWSGE